MKHVKLLKWEALQHRPKHLSPFRPGDTIRVVTKVFEGERERLQTYEGVVIRFRKSYAGQLGESFTVRRVSFGIGIERTFPVFSPVVQKITVVKRGRVRRSRLYYLRERMGRSAKVEELVTFTRPTAPSGGTPAAPSEGRSGDAPQPPASGGDSPRSESLDPAPSSA